jgi:HEPN domain-containing protein
MRSSSGLDTFLRQQLPVIDECLSAEGRPVHDRTLIAARIIIDLCLVSIDGDTKDNYLTKSWFAEIYRSVCKWYERRYGEERIHSQPAHIRGLVEHFSVPYILRIPLVFSEPGEDNTAWVIFPKEVLAAEVPLSWIEDSPSLDALPSDRKQKLEASTTEVATVLRGINNNLNSADLGKGNIRALADNIRCHLDKAAVDIATMEPGSTALAIWELQMACEKSMKVFLAQRGVTYPETHDLRALRKLTPELEKHPELKRAVSSLPSDGRIIKWRHAEIAPPPTAEALRYYGTALFVCGFCSERMLRKYVFKNFALQIRLPR